jgi:hypothetical protein
LYDVQAQDDKKIGEWGAQLAAKFPEFAKDVGN